MLLIHWWKAAVGWRNVWIIVSIFWLAQQIDRYSSDLLPVLLFLDLSMTDLSSYKILLCVIQISTNSHVEEHCKTQGHQNLVKSLKSQWRLNFSATQSSEFLKRMEAELRMAVLTLYFQMMCLHGMKRLVCNSRWRVEASWPKTHVNHCFSRY